MDNAREKRQRERNPITGDGMVDRDTQGTIHHFRSLEHLPLPTNSMRDMDDATDTDKSSIMSEEELSARTLERDNNEELHSKLSSLTLQELNSVPRMPNTDKSTSEASTLSLARVSRQRQRDRNPITGDGMRDHDYRCIVPSFKTHGPQRAEVNPLNFEGYVGDDKAYQSEVQDASISPLTRKEEKTAIVEEKVAYDISNKPVSRQRQRDRNPITGFGMEDRDFRVQIPTFKIHGPQRQSGDPLTGTGYDKIDKQYLQQIKDASNSPLNSPCSPDNGAKSRFD